MTGDKLAGGDSIVRLAIDLWLVSWQGKDLANANDSPNGAICCNLTQLLAIVYYSKL